MPGRKEDARAIFLLSRAVNFGVGRGVVAWLRPATEVVGLDLYGLLGGRGVGATGEEKWPRPRPRLLLRFGLADAPMLSATCSLFAVCLVGSATARPEPTFHT